MADIARTNVCRTCKKTLSIENFVKDRNRKKGCTNQCKPCHADSYRKRYPMESSRRLNRKFPYVGGKRDYVSEALWNRYGITKENLEQMKTDQGNRCYLCNVIPTRLVIDHCHKTNKVRKLLCDKCNSGIGYLESDAYDEKKIKEYLNGY